MRPCAAQRNDELRTQPSLCGIEAGRGDQPEGGAQRRKEKPICNFKTRKVDKLNDRLEKSTNRMGAAKIRTHHKFRPSPGPPGDPWKLGISDRGSDRDQATCDRRVAGADL